MKDFHDWEASGRNMRVTSLRRGRTENHSRGSLQGMRLWVPSAVPVCEQHTWKARNPCHKEEEEIGLLSLRQTG